MTNTRASLPALRLQALSRRFGEITAVDSVDLSINRGQVVAFLGPNGAGKSTTIDMILGLLRPDSGSVALFGKSPRQAVADGDVAAVMQVGGLLKDLTVAETVRYVGSLYPRPRPAAEVIERAGLTAIAHRMVGKCSGGEQQRLRFALALLPQPRLLILDEPTAGMDVEGRRQFWTAIRRDADRGRTILFATHYLEEADTYADRVVLMRRGRIVADGTAAAIRARSSGRLVRATWPRARAADIALVPCVSSVHVRGDTIYIDAEDSDAVVRHLLTATPAHDVEITTHNLESAFLALTGQSSSATTREGIPA